MSEREGDPRPTLDYQPPAALRDPTHEARYPVAYVMASLVGIALVSFGFVALIFAIVFLVHWSDARVDWRAADALGKARTAGLLATILLGVGGYYTLLGRRRWR